MQRKQTFFWLDFPPGVCVCASVCVLPSRCHLHVETGIKVECYTWSHSLSFYLPSCLFVCALRGFAACCSRLDWGNLHLAPWQGFVGYFKCRKCMCRQVHNFCRVFVSLLRLCKTRDFKWNKTQPEENAGKKKLWTEVKEKKTKKRGKSFNWI